jgi:CHAT domain-containing protein
MRCGRAIALAGLVTGLVGLAPVIVMPGVAQVVAQTREQRKAEGDRLLEQGIQDYNDRKYTDAEESFQHALIIYRSIQNQNGIATVLLHLGMSYGSDKEAVAYYEKSLTLFRQLKNRAGEAKALMQLGDWYSSAEQHQKAVPYLEQSVAIFKQLNDCINLKDVFADLTVAHLFLSRNDKMEFYSKEYEKLQCNSLQLKKLSSNQTVESSLLLLSPAISQTVQDSKAEADFLLKKGIRQIESREPEAALKALEQALKIYRMIKDRPSEGKALANLGRAHFAFKSYAKAIEYSEQSLAIARAIKDQQLEVQVLKRLGLIYLRTGNHAKAISLVENRLAIHQKSNNRTEEVRTLGDLGFVYLRAGNTAKAIEVQERGVKLAQELKDDSLIFEARGNLNETYNSILQVDNLSVQMGQAPISTALRAEKTTQRRVEADRLLQQGIQFLESWNADAALKPLESALRIYQEIKNRQGEGKTLFNLAKVYSLSKQHDKAADSYERALPIYLEQNAGVSEILFNLGDSYMATAQYQKAINHYENLLSVYENYPNMMRAESHAGLLMQLSNAYSALSQHEKAYSYYKRAISLFNAAFGRDEDIGIFSDFGLFFERHNQPELAIAFYKKSVNGHEAFRRRLLSSRQAVLPFPFKMSNQQSREVRESYTKYVAGDYRNLANLLLSRNRTIEALQVLDLLKVKDLQDFLGKSNSKTQFDESIELFPEEKKILHNFQVLITLHFQPSPWFWKDFRTDTQGNLFTSDGHKIEQVAYAKERQASQRKLIGSFPENPAIKSAIQSLQSTAIDQNLKLKTYQDLQARRQKLGNNVALFYPLVLDDRLELVILTRDRPPVRKPVAITSKQLEAEVKTFREQLDGRSPLIKESAKKLYQSLFQPLESELKAAGVDTIVYAPDSFMRYVPLAALYDGSQWIAQRYQINYLTALALTPLDPDLNTNPRLLAAALTQDRQVNLLGKTHRFPALQFTQPEVSNLAKLLPNTTTLIDQTFNRPNLDKGVPQSTILHLATHGMFVPGSPDQSIILLGDGSTISLREIEQQWKFPNLSLVVLSACETAIGGKLGNGIEVLGFGYQMQRTGSRAAMSSLWKVDDGGTQVLMNTFYSALQQGMTKAKALQETQKALITGNYTTVGGKRSDVEVRIDSRITQSSAISDRLSHPYYWAPFILIGNGL